MQCRSDWPMGGTVVDVSCTSLPQWARCLLETAMLLKDSSYTGAIIGRIVSPEYKTWLRSTSFSRLITQCQQTGSLDRGLRIPLYLRCGGKESFSMKVSVTGPSEQLQSDYFSSSFHSKRQCQDGQGCVRSGGNFSMGCYWHADPEPSWRPSQPPQVHSTLSVHRSQEI